MSEYYYSFKEKGFFWQPDTESYNYPDDLIPLTDEYYRELMQGQVDGKYIEHRKGG
ncbi:tail fiber assembly protein, partial [Salmonella enterica]|nr:tail fiber assembly protein [Salmonella enterica]